MTCLFGPFLLFSDVAFADYNPVIGSQFEVNIKMMNTADPFLEFNNTYNLYRSANNIIYPTKDQ